MTAPILGAHLSVAGGLHKALFEARALDCNAVQIFTKNARTWKEHALADEQVRQFTTARQETRIRFIYSHGSYLINIAGENQEKRRQSVRALTAEMERAGRLGLTGVVLHPGAHLGFGMEKGLEIAGEVLRRVLSADRGHFPPLLLETTAGTGTSLGSRFEELAYLLSVLTPFEKIGICIDTSHIFAAGYDLRTAEALDHTLNAFHRHIGLARLRLLHLNDSVPDLGSRKDRHTHIGKGKIGADGFSAIMKAPALLEIPKVIETPKEQNGILMDPVNLSYLRQLAH